MGDTSIEKTGISQKHRFQPSKLHIIMETPRMTFEADLEVQRGCSNTQNRANVVDFAASERRLPFDEAGAELAKPT